MSYSVEYNPELQKSYPMKHKTIRKIPTKTILISILVIAIIYVLNVFDIIRLFVPGDPAVIAGAFTSMVNQVRAGQTVSEAIFTFFADVITGGK